MPNSFLKKDQPKPFANIVPGNVVENARVNVGRCVLRLPSRGCYILDENDCKLLEPDLKLAEKEICEVIIHDMDAFNELTKHFADYQNFYNLNAVKKQKAHKGIVSLLKKELRLMKKQTKKEEQKSHDESGLSYAV